MDTGDDCSSDLQMLHACVALWIEASLGLAKAAGHIYQI